MSKQGATPHSTALAGRAGDVAPTVCTKPRTKRHAVASRLAPATMMDEVILLNAMLTHCRVCCCTEYNACEGALGGCYWVEPDLCSRCAPPDHPGLIRVRGVTIR